MNPYKSEKEEEASHATTSYPNSHATTSKEVNGSLPLLLLPQHLIFDVLSRLPIRTIFICKCVCNTFKKILSDPYFAQLHLSKASLNDYSLVIQDLEFRNIFLTPLLDLDKHALDAENGAYVSWQTLTPPASMIKVPRTKRLDVVASIMGSCNGLLCLKYYIKNYDYRFYVCNPILGEFTMLPQSRSNSSQFAGFGFCLKTKQYKVLRFISHSRNRYILTLGIDNDWREISDPPPGPFGIKYLDSSYKGNLHWIINRSICSFNLETERYLYISLPSCFIDDPNLDPPLQIGMLDGSFCISYMLLDQFEVYVMEDYKVKESWIKRISIDTSYEFNDCGNISTIRFLDNGVWLFSKDCLLTYFDTRKGTTYCINVAGDYSATAHIPSLMSLKDIVRRENVEQVQRKMQGIFCTKADKYQVE